MGTVTPDNEAKLGMCGAMIEMVDTVDMAMQMGDRVKSPCVRRCCLNECNVCLGCFRTLQEILDWHEADDDERRRILAGAAERRAMDRRTQFIPLKSLFPKRYR